MIDRMKFKEERMLSCCLLVLLTVCLLVACTENQEQLPEKGLTRIRILLIGENLSMDRVLEKYESELAEELGIILDIEIMKTSDYQQQLGFKMESQEALDLVFNAPWINMSEMISQGKLLELDDYFNNPEYPGLISAFSEEFLDANRFNGKLYGVPVSEFMTDTKGIAYRKDLLKKYQLGFERITTLEQLQIFYDAVQANEDSIAPIWLSDRGFFKIFENEVTLNLNHIFTLPGWSSYSVPVYVVLDEKEENVLDVLFLGDSDERFSRLGKNNGENFIVEQMHRNAIWAKYSQAHSLMSYSGDFAMAQGLAASIETSMGSNGLVDKQLALQKNVPEGELDFFSYNKEYYEDMQPYTIPAIMQAWNFVCIPEYSRNAEQTMQFLNWLYGSEDHLLEFSYGIEGENWERCGDSSYHVLQNDEKYVFPAFAMTLNPEHVMYMEGVTEEQKEFLDIQGLKHPFYSSRLSGFILEPSKIAVEINNVSDLYQEYYMAFAHGAYGGETDIKIREFYEQAQEFNLETIRKEIIEQVQEYLDKQE